MHCCSGVSSQQHMETSSCGVHSWLCKFCDEFGIEKSTLSVFIPLRIFQGIARTLSESLRLIQRETRLNKSYPATPWWDLVQPLFGQSSKLVPVEPFRLSPGSSNIKCPLRYRARNTGSSGTDIYLATATRSSVCRCRVEVRPKIRRTQPPYRALG